MRTFYQLKMESHGWRLKGVNCRGESTFCHARLIILTISYKNNLTEEETYLSVPLDAEVNVGLPIHLIKSNLDELLNLIEIQ